jgi:tyrosyl-tRNA synthetase
MAINQDKQKIEELLNRGVENIYPSKNALESELLAGKKLKLYQGFDPTGIKLHIGHMVGLMKLKQWQELGHEVIFLIGDGTGQAGDPSGKTRSRDKYLSNKELRENSKDYVMQAGRVVKFEGSNAAKILYNGDWLNKLTMPEILKILDNFSWQQLSERDLYVEKNKKGETINMREFFYPILQAYDSVSMNVDLELGGDDQTFNMLVGRALMKKMLKKEKFVMTTPLLVDSSGKKIGKTEGNVIALDSNSNDFYGMVMSLSDDIIIKGFEYLTEIPMKDVKEIKSKIKLGENPMIFKKKLAYELTKMLNSESDAKKAQEEFEHVFKDKENPENMDEIKIAEDKLKLIDLISKTKLVSSNSEARRLIEQGAVKIDNQKSKDQNKEIEIKNGMVVQVGKRRFCKIVK